MKSIIIIFGFLLMNSFSFATNFVDAKLDTVNVEIISDDVCPNALVNFHVINKSSTPLDSIWWKGDYDVNSQNYFFNRNGSASDPDILNPRWIFFSNTGIGKFPVSVEVKNVLGFRKMYYDTVDIGEPWIEFLNDPLTCCGFDDTIKVKAWFLTKPYDNCMWLDNTTGMVFPINGDKFPLVLLTGRSSVNLEVRMEDSKGCSAKGIKFFNLTTGISKLYNPPIFIHPNPTSNKITITGLPQNESNDLSIFDLLGKLVLSQKVQGTTEVDLTGLSKGVYFVRVGATTKKIIRN